MTSTPSTLNLSGQALASKLLQPSRQAYLTERNLDLDHAHPAIGFSLIDQPALLPPLPISYYERIKDPKLNSDLNAFHLKAIQEKATPPSPQRLDPRPFSHISSPYANSPTPYGGTHSVPLSSMNPSVALSPTRIPSFSPPLAISNQQNRSSIPLPSQARSSIENTFDPQIVSRVPKLQTDCSELDLVRRKLEAKEIEIAKLRATQPLDPPTPHPPNSSAPRLSQSNLILEAQEQLRIQNENFERLRLEYELLRRQESSAESESTKLVRLLEEKIQQLERKLSTSPASQRSSLHVPQPSIIHVPQPLSTTRVSQSVNPNRISQVATKDCLSHLITAGRSPQPANPTRASHSIIANRIPQPIHPPTPQPLRTTRTINSIHIQDPPRMIVSRAPQPIEPSTPRAVDVSTRKTVSSLQGSQYYNLPAIQVFNAELSSQTTPNSPGIQYSRRAKETPPQPLIAPRTFPPTNPPSSQPLVTSTRTFPPTNPLTSQPLPTARFSDSGTSSAAYSCQPSPTNLPTRPLNSPPAHPPTLQGAPRSSSLLPSATAAKRSLNSSATTSSSSKGPSTAEYLFQSFAPKPPSGTSLSESTEYSLAEKVMERNLVRSFSQTPKPRAFSFSNPSI